MYVQVNIGKGYALVLVASEIKKVERLDLRNILNGNSCSK